MNLIECPRDAMQGLKYFIPTDRKIEYLNQLLKVGFHTIDFGSFVSPKAVPQMRDTHEVIKNLDTKNSKSRLLAIVANHRGAEEALEYEQITSLGYPLSISETFQRRNTNSTISQSLNLLEELFDLTSGSKVELVVYLSMGFGNPYGDPYDLDMLQQYINEVTEIGISTISIADTIGQASGSDIIEVFSQIEYQENVHVGAHLHSTPDNVDEICKALIKVGCSRIDTTIKGFGGCPFAEDKLTGNLPTEEFLGHYMPSAPSFEIDFTELQKAIELAEEVFNP